MTDVFVKQDIATVYTEQFPRVYRWFASRHHRTHEEAEDLTQDVFVKATSAYERYEPTYPVGAWIFTIAHNVLADTIRRSKARPSTVTIDNPEAPLVHKALETADIAKATDALVDVTTALEAITREAPRQAEVITAYLQGESRLDTAARLKLTDDAVAKLRGRGKSSMLRLLEPPVRSARGRRRNTSLVARNRGPHQRICDIVAHSDLSVLTERQRAVLTAMYIDCLPANEAGAALGIKAGTVTAHAQNALKILRKMAIAA